PTDMQYQWKKDGEKIEAATSSSYTIPLAGQSDVGSYACVVTNLAGQATSNPATLTIDEPPKIALASDEAITWEMGTAFPDDQLGYKAADKEDGDITAKVEVDNRVDRTKPGKYAIHYRVKDSAENEAQAAKTVEVVDTKPPYAADFSPAGGVEVRSGDKISFQVKDNGVGVDKDSITITVDGAPAKPTITPLAGGLKDYAVSLNLPDKLEQDKVVVAVDAKDLHDPPNAMVKETYAFKTPEPELPKITQQPASVAVAVGESVKLNVAATGTPPLTYIWEKDGAELKRGPEPSYEIRVVKASDAGSYTCLVQDRAGKARSDPATLGVFDFDAFWKEYEKDFKTPDKFKLHYAMADDGLKKALPWYEPGRDEERDRIELQEPRPRPPYERKDGNIVVKVHLKAYFMSTGAFLKGRSFPDSVSEEWVIDPKTGKIVEVRKP
ncbi:MAG: immunoglobulin domain-containing protein, partial [bacterium]|nr:immunoglobulin domain-containing protein [bacterium]